MTNAELKARKLISERTTEQLVSDFELTDRINDVNISAVRGKAKRMFGKQERRYLIGGLKNTNEYQKDK